MCCKLKKVDKVEVVEVDKMELIKLEFFIDLDNPASRYSQLFVFFKDGCWGVDQVIDILQWDWEPDANQGTC